MVCIEEAHMQALNKTDWWKVQLGKYMKYVCGSLSLSVT